MCGCGIHINAGATRASWWWTASSSWATRARSAHARTHACMYILGYIHTYPPNPHYNLDPTTSYSLSYTPCPPTRNLHQQKTSTPQPPFSRQGGLMGVSKILLRLNLGHITKRTAPEKSPCRDPAYTDQFTFNVRAYVRMSVAERSWMLGVLIWCTCKPTHETKQIDQAVLGTTLDVTAIETPAVGPSKVRTHIHAYEPTNLSNTLISNPIDHSSWARPASTWPRSRAALGRWRRTGPST